MQSRLSRDEKQNINLKYLVRLVDDEQVALLLKMQEELIQQWERVQKLKTQCG